MFHPRAAHDAKGQAGAPRRPGLFPWSVEAGEPSGAICTGPALLPKRYRNRFLPVFDMPGRFLPSHITGRAPGPSPGRDSCSIRLEPDRIAREHAFLPHGPFHLVQIQGGFRAQVLDAFLRDEHRVLHTDVEALFRDDELGI